MKILIGFLVWLGGWMLLGVLGVAATIAFVIYFLTLFPSLLR